MQKGATWASKVDRPYWVAARRASHSLVVDGNTEFKPRSSSSIPALAMGLIVSAFTGQQVDSALKNPSRMHVTANGRGGTGVMP